VTTGVQLSIWANHFLATNFSNGVNVNVSAFGSISSIRDDILYGSFRVRGRSTSNDGRSSGVSMSLSQIAVNIPNIGGDTIYRFDWYPNRTDYYLNNTYVTSDITVVRAPGRAIFSRNSAVWTVGDVDSYFVVKYVEVFFNDTRNIRCDFKPVPPVVVVKPAKYNYLPVAIVGGSLGFVILASLGAFLFIRYRKKTPSAPTPVAEAPAPLVEMTPVPLEAVAEVPIETVVPVEGPPDVPLPEPPVDVAVRELKEPAVEVPKETMQYFRRY
jgi:hypothetical protein